MANTRKRSPAGRSQSRRSSIGRRKRARRRSRRRRRAILIAPFSFLRSRGLPRLPALEQRGRDVLGLGLVAAGVFMGFVLYGGWDGGRAGHGLAVAGGWLLGRARALVPLALAAGGAALLLHPLAAGGESDALSGRESPSAPGGDRPPDRRAVG